MAMPDHDEAYVMDLTALLKALRATRQDAAQVVEQLGEHLHAVRDLDGRAAHTLTQAVQRATASLQQEQARTIAQIGAEAQRQQAALTQQLQQVVAQAARVRRWLPWKVAALLLGATLLVNVGATAWWWGQRAERCRRCVPRSSLRLGSPTIWLPPSIPSSRKPSSTSWRRSTQRPGLRLSAHGNADHDWSSSMHTGQCWCALPVDVSRENGYGQGKHPLREDTLMHVTIELPDE